MSKYPSEIKLKEFSLNTPNNDLRDRRINPSNPTPPIWGNLGTTPMPPIAPFPPPAYLSTPPLPEPLVKVHKPASAFLQEGLDILVERGKMRDSGDGKERSMKKVVEMFNTAYGTNLTVEQGWGFMVLLKFVRSATGNYNEDSYIDGPNYFALMGEEASTERTKKETK